MIRRLCILLMAAALFVAAGSPALLRSVDSKPKASVPTRTHAGRPLAFEANAGQFNPEARFVARTARYSLFFTEREAVLSGGQDVVRLRFDQTSPRTRLVPVEPLAGKTNYLVGNDPAKWKTGISNYARLRYEELYPGIDLVFYGNDNELEYDLVVSPGSDPAIVRMTMDGARDLTVAGNGDLVGRAASGELRLRKPVIYQRAADGTTTPIDGRYRIDDERAVAFDIDDYDRAVPLVIDPVVVYSTYLGGNERDITAGSSGGGARQMIAVDATGAAYVTGTTDSLDFPTTAGSFQPSPTNPRSPSVFVTKIAPDGESLVYSTYIHGTIGGLYGNQEASGEGIAVDAWGNAFVVGNAISGDFPASVAPFAPFRDRNLFLLKLDPSGSSLVYSILFSAGYTDSVTGVAVDNAGNAYVTGATGGLGTILVPEDALQPACNCLNGRVDAFVVKFNATATAVVYGTYLGGGFRDAGAGIAVNAAGEAYVTGRTGSDDFPVFNAAQPILGGGLYDDFVVKLNASGSALVFSTFLGGGDTETGNALGSAIAVDAAGNAYVTGYTNSGDFPRTLGAYQVDPPGPGSNPRAYATKFTAGGQIAYSTFLAGNGGSFGTSVAVDAQGRAYLAGSTGSTNFPIPVDAPQPAFAGGGNDVYIVVLDPSGSTAEFATYLGGPFGFEYATGIALGPGGSVYVAGTTEGLGTFPTTPSAVQPNYGGNTDAFVARIDLQPPDTTPPDISAVTVDPGVLWPPNHTMRLVTVTATATDAESAVMCAITNITSNEPVSGINNGDPSPDWQDTAGLTTWLRAERDARRSGRVYTLTITCSDEAGNTSTRTVGVSVPRSQ